MKNGKKRGHQLGSVLLIIALITAFFAVGLYTSGNGITGAAVGLERISGMQTSPQTRTMTYDIEYTQGNIDNKGYDSIWMNTGTNSIIYVNEKTPIAYRYSIWDVNRPSVLYDDNNLGPEALAISKWLKESDTWNPYYTSKVRIEVSTTTASGALVEEPNPSNGKAETKTTKSEAVDNILKFFKKDSTIVDEQVSTTNEEKLDYLFCKDGECLAQQITNEELIILNSKDITRIKLESEQAKAAYNAQKNGFTITSYSNSILSLSKKTEKDKTDAEGTFISEIFDITINEKGQEKSRTIINNNEDSQITSRYELKFTYDDKGNVVETEKTTLKYTDGVRSGTKITYDKNGKPIDAKEYKDGDFVDNEKMLSTLQEQYVWRQRFAFIDLIFTSYSGLGYYATLFFDDEDLSQWKESVDQAFATLYLGTEYWESEICSLSIDRDQQGVAYIDTRLGLAAVAAHIEATRSPLIILPPSEGGGREFLYKITFNVKNGEYDKDPKALEVMRFNVILKGERTARLFGNDIEVKRGNEFGVLGNEAIVQFSNFFYDEICIKFEDVPSFWTLDDDELCNKIIGAPSSGQPIGSSSGEGAQESQGDNVLDI